MALPAMITQMGQQQFNYGASVADSLRKLGDEVGKTLVMQQFQKEAAAELPFMQQAMQSAMGKIGQGDVAGGYMDAMMALPLASQNPIVQAAANNYFKGMQQAAEFKQSSLWRDLQASRMGGGGGGTTGPMGFRVPSAEALSDPNAQFESDMIYAEEGLPAMGFGGGALQGTEDQRRQQAEADRMYGAPMDPDAQAGRDLMALEPEGQQGGMSFGFGTISQFKPKDDVIEATQEEVAKYKGLSPDGKADYTAKLIETDTEYSPPQGRKASPFAGIVGFEDVVYIEGPVTGGQKVTKVEETYSQRTGKSVKRELAPADKSDEQTFDAFVANMEQASRFAMRNPQLRKIIEATGGDLTRVDFQDEETDTGETVFKAYVDGTDMGVLSTKENFNEKAALEMLADAPAVMRRNGWKVIKGERPAAPAEEEGAQETGAPAPAPSLPAAPDNPFAQPAEQEATRLAAAQETKSKAQRKSEIRRLTQQLQALTPRKTAGLMAMEAGAEGEPAAGMKQAEQADLKQKYDRLYWQIDRLKAVDEGRVFETEAEAKKKSFKSGTIIYIAGKLVRVK